MVEIPGHRFARRRGGEPSADANCQSPRPTHALDDVNLDELRCEWRQLYRSEPPKISRDPLIRGIGYRLQEIQHGGLGKSTRHKLKTHPSAKGLITHSFLECGVSRGYLGIVTARRRAVTYQ
jgi:hypothetical protein